MDGLSQGGASRGVNSANDPRPRASQSLAPGRRLNNETIRQTKMNDSIETQIDKLVPQWTRLFKTLKGDIGDDYRASEDSEDNTPGMCVTIGFTPNRDDEDASWSYQTGDNSFSGGAYSHPHWAVVSLYRRSNSRELAKDCADQIAELIAC